MFKKMFLNTSSGFEVSNNGINMIRLSKSGPRITCDELKTIKNSDGSVIDQKQMLSDMLNEIVGNSQININSAFVTLNCKDILIRKITLPNMSDKDIPLAVKYELEANSILPWKIEETVYDWVIDEQLRTYISILVVALHRDYIYSILTVFKKANIHIRGIEIEQFSNLRLLNYNYQLNDNKLILIIKKSGKMVSLVFSEGNRYLLSRLINLNNNLIATDDCTIKLRQEINTSINYLQTVEKFNREKIDIYFCGEQWEGHEKLFDSLKVIVDFELYRLDPFTYIDKIIEEQINTCNFSTVTGLALRRWFN